MTVKFSIKLKTNIWFERFGKTIFGRCSHCNIPIVIPNDIYKNFYKTNLPSYMNVTFEYDSTHFDHIISIANGGKSDKNNIQVLCQKCNLYKSTNNMCKPKKEIYEYCYMDIDVPENHCNGVVIDRYTKKAKMCNNKSVFNGKCPCHYNQKNGF